MEAMKSYYTVKQISELIRPNWVHSVEREGNYIVITTATDKAHARECNLCKSGYHAGLVSTPRIKIAAY